MRLLLGLVGAASLAAVGWIFWRATAESRDWREFLTLGTQAKRNQAEWDRYVHLGRRLFPQESGPVAATAILNGPGDRRRILVSFFLRDKSGKMADLCVLDDDRRLLSRTLMTPGPCGIAVRPAPEREPWAFDFEKRTPGRGMICRYTLIDDRPSLVSVQE